MSQFFKFRIVPKSSTLINRNINSNINNIKTIREPVGLPGFRDNIINILKINK